MNADCCVYSTGISVGSKRILSVCINHKTTATVYAAVAANTSKRFPKCLECT